LNFAELGKHKDFTAYPELLDIHVDRLVKANSLVHTYMKDSELLRSGLIRFDKFLGSGFEEIAEEIKKVKPRDKRDPQSQIVNLPNSRSFQIAGMLLEVVTTLFQEHMKQEVKLMFEWMTYLQHLVNSPDDQDDQKVFHTDTFFHCVKFWYFPKAVTRDEGAFWYVPYSPVLTDKLIDWHKQRIDELKIDRVAAWRGWGHKEGSLRISLDEIADLGLKPQAVEVEEDTLVVANVFGFHRRGDTKAPTHRFAIHGSLRIDNPFTCVVA
jgi:hypothetical protein